MPGACLSIQCLKRAIVSLALCLSAPQALASDWGPWPMAKGSAFVAAGYEHDDGGALIVMCDTTTKLVSLALRETRADWVPGSAIKFMTRADDGSQLNDDLGRVLDPTHLILREQATWHLHAMGKAIATFAVGTGEYGRIFPALNFRKAVAPVLAACGDSW